MKSQRMQHTIPATIVLALSGMVCWISFTQEPAEAFLFARIISIFMLFLSLWNFKRAFLGMAKVGVGFEAKQLKTILPGIGIMLVYVFFLAETLGFYIASTLTFIAVFSLYDPAPHTDILSWIKRSGIALFFMALIFGLFSFLLQVQTPRGMFF